MISCVRPHSVIIDRNTEGSMPEIHFVFVLCRHESAWFERLGRADNAARK